MGQHNSFKKDIDMLSEAYHQMYGKGELVEEGALKGAALGGLAGGVGGGVAVPIIGAPIGAALGGLGGLVAGAAGDEEDKTGGKSDHDLLDAVEKKHTAGKALIDKAHQELSGPDGSLSAHTRESLARDEYGYGGEDAEAAAKYPTFHKSEKKKSDGYNPWDDLPEGWDDEDAEMIYGDKPLTQREKDQHDAERAGVARKGKHSFTHKEDKPYGHDFDWDDDEEEEDTDEADAEQEELDDLSHPPV